MTRSLLILLVSCCTMGAIAQAVRTQKGVETSPTTAVQAKKAEKKINWVSFKEAQESQKVARKKIFVDVYTDWCGWCKRMDASTFSDPDIIDYINQNYYAVKFNAEQSEAIEWNGKVYKNQGSGARSTHELAVFLLNNRLGYPTTVFLDEDLGLIQPLPGYLDAQKLEPILHYFGSDSHKKLSWDAYQKEWKKG